MAWYLSLFDRVYQSSVGKKILSAIETSTLSGNYPGAFLCYLAVRKFERIATSTDQDDRELRQAFELVLKALESIGHPLSAEDLKVLAEIFERNGLPLNFAEDRAG